MKKTYKLLIMMSIIVITTFSIIGCSQKDKKDNESFSIGIVLSKGSAQDKSLNQLAISSLEKAKEEFGIEGEYIETKKDRQYLTNIETFVEEEKDLIIGIGRETSEAMLEAARAYTENKFVLIDYNYKDDDEGIPSNMICITFRERQIGYLVGIVAGSMTKTDKVGFIGEEKISNTVKFEEGFVAGVKSINPKIEIISSYTESNEKDELEKSIASEMFTDDVDIVFCSDSKYTKVVVEEAKLQNKYVIGVNMDQNSLAPDNILTSAVKNIELSMLEIIEDTIDEKFRGGREVIYGLTEDGVGIAETTNKNVPKEVIDIVNDASAKIIEWNSRIIKNN